MGAGAIIVLLVLAAGLGAAAQFVGASRLRTPTTSGDWAIAAVLRLFQRAAGVPG